MKHYKVGIIGCGVILPRHLESMQENSNFELVALCDIQDSLVNSLSKKYRVKSFIDYKKLIDSKLVNFIVVATPNSLHFKQAKYALENGCDVLVEKPVSFNSSHIKDLDNLAKKHNQNAYCVLQVRLNPTINIIKETLKQNLLGNIRVAERQLE